MYQIINIFPFYLHICNIRINAIGYYVPNRLKKLELQIHSGLHGCNCMFIFITYAQQLYSKNNV